VTTTQNVFSERSYLVVANSFLEHIKDENQQSINTGHKKAGLLHASWGYNFFAEIVVRP
jgi:hypothetical protein